MRPSIICAEPHDLSKLVEIEHQVFSCDRIAHRQFRYLMYKANGIVVKAEFGGRLLGYMILLKRKKSRKLRIYSIGVCAMARKRGIAQKMLIFAEAYAQQHELEQLTLEVCENNHCAIRLYHAAGYRYYGIKKGYYEDGCSALLLRKFVTSGEMTQ